MATVDEHVMRRPAAGLRPLIAGYSGYRQAGLPPAVHRGLPSPYLTLIVALDDPLVVAAHPDPGQPAGSYDTLVGGLHTAPALITHQGRQSGIQVALSPLGAGALLGQPAGQLASLDVGGADVLGPLAGQLRERLRACATWPQRFAVLDELLLARACGGAASGGAASGGAAGGGAAGGWTHGSWAGISPEVGHAWQTLLRSGGRASVSRLAADTGWSDRHLRTRFRAQVGLTPKAAARVIRFDRARRQLQRQVQAGRRPGLAELAAGHGYYDQAHLDREFGALAGCPPTAWLAQEFRNVQAADDPGWEADQHER